MILKINTKIKKRILLLRAVTVPVMIRHHPLATATTMTKSEYPRLLLPARMMMNFCNIEMSRNKKRNYNENALYAVIYTYPPPQMTLWLLTLFSFLRSIFIYLYPLYYICGLVVVVYLSLSIHKLENTPLCYLRLF